MMDDNGLSELGVAWANSVIAGYVEKGWTASAAEAAKNFFNRELTQGELCRLIEKKCGHSVWVAQKLLKRLTHEDIQYFESVNWHLFPKIGELYWR